MQTKIVLLEPYGANVQHSADHFKKGNMAPPYALESLGGYLIENLINKEKDNSISVAIIHQRSFNKKDFGLDSEGIISISLQDIIDIIKEQRKMCDQIIIGIRAVTPIILYALKIALAIKKEINDAVVIIGGYYVSEVKEMIYKSNTFQRLEAEINGGLIDCFVLGEGEETLLEIVKYIHKGEKVQDFIHKIDGVMYLDKKIPKVTLPRLRISGPENDCYNMHLPRAYRRVRIPIRDQEEKFLYSIEVPSGIGCTQYFSFPSVNDIHEMQINFGRGCFKGCPFCSSPAIWGQKVIYRDPKEVVDEIIECHIKDGVNFVYFADLYFNQNIEMLKIICKEMKKRKRKDGTPYFGGNDINNIHWFCLAGAFNIRSDKELDKINKIILLMYEAGCSKIGIGIEGFNPESMLNMKDCDDDPIDRATDIILSLHLANITGIITRGFFICGTEIGESIDRAKEILGTEIPQRFFNSYELLKFAVAEIYYGDSILHDECEQTTRLFEIDHLRVVPETPYYSTQTGKTRKLREINLTLKELIDSGDDEITAICDQDYSLLECDESKETIEHFVKKDMVRYFYSMPSYIKNVQQKVKRFPHLKKTFLHWNKFLSNAMNVNFDWGL